MEIETIQAILSKKEDILRRHLVLSTSVIEKLHQMDVIGKYTRDQMMVSDVGYILLPLSTLYGDVRKLSHNYS